MRRLAAVMVTAVMALAAVCAFAEGDAQSEWKTEIGAPTMTLKQDALKPEKKETLGYGSLIHGADVYRPAAGADALGFADEISVTFELKVDPSALKTPISGETRGLQDSPVAQALNEKSGNFRKPELTVKE